MDRQLRRGIARYRKKSSASAVFELLATIFLGAAFYVLGIVSARAGSYALMLLYAVVTGTFVVRLFIIQHDCGHASFFPSKRANDILGFSIGVVTLTAFHCWRRYHAMHHAHSGNLDARDFGDIRTLTVAEYAQLSALKRCLYRLYRNPIVLFGVGPLLMFLIRQRLTFYIPKQWKVERNSVHATNACIAVIIVLIAASGGAGVFFLFHLPVMLVASSIGVWLFYIQHQFPESYWKKKADWNPIQAGLLGSSHYDLPRIARWMTANIGLHHIHHLDRSIPSYNLHKCFIGHLALHAATRFTFKQSLSYSRLKLWDEERGLMVRFPTRRQASELACTPG